MKTNSVFKILFLLILIFTIVTAKAQGPKLCGPYKINIPALEQAKKFELKTLKLLAPTSFLIRVYFHICRDDDGTNAGATTAQIESELTQLLLDYSVNNVCFINMGFDYIDNTSINNLNPNIPSQVALLNSHLVPNTINIFYHATLGTYGGYAYNIPNTFCSIARGNIAAGHTISHEAGHCLGMLHTFEPAYGFEDIDGSNSSTAADQITDTRADPWAYNGRICFTTNTCSYTGTCADPKGASNFSPPYSNMMAYWWSTGCYPALGFTSNQFIRINAFLLATTILQNCESPANVTFGPDVSYTSGYLMTSAINTVITNGSAIISGSTTATLGGQLVLLEPGFRASPTDAGSVLIRISRCILTSAKPVDITKIDTKPVEEVNDVSLNTPNTLSAFPNPASSVMHLAFSLNHDEKNAVVQVYDMKMMKVQEVTLSNLIKGKQTISMNIKSITSGTYVVVLKSSSAIYRTKVVIAK